MTLTIAQALGQTPRPMMVHVELAPGAEENGFATMVADLVRQNLEAKPHKQRDFAAIAGSVALVAEDADVALTMKFEKGKLAVCDGISGMPDVTIRGSSDAILSLSNLPLTSRLGLPLPGVRDREGWRVMGEVWRFLRGGQFHIYGMTAHLPLVTRLTRIMSVNG